MFTHTDKSTILNKEPGLYKVYETFKLYITNNDVNIVYERSSVKYLLDKRLDTEPKEAPLKLFSRPTFENTYFVTL